MVQEKDKYLDVLWYHRWLALTVFAVVLLGALIGSLMTEKVYRVRAELFVQPKPVTVSGSLETANAETDYKLMNNQLEILRSDRVAGRAVNYIRARLGKTFPVSAAGLEQGLTVAKKEYASVITLELRASVQPRQLQAMMQEYLRAYRDTLESMNTDKFMREGEFLEKQLSLAHQALSEATASIHEFEASHHAYSIDSQLSQMVQLSSVLDEQANQLASGIKAVAGEIQLSQKKLPAPAKYRHALSRLERDPQANNLRRRILELEAEQSDWGGLLTDSHPQMQTFDQELSHLSGLLKQRLARLGAEFKPGKQVASGLQLDFALLETMVENRIKFESLQSRVQELASARRDLMRKLSRMPGESVGYARLKHRVERAQETVQSLETRLDESALMREASNAFIKVDVLKQPGVPSEPVEPRLPENLLAGLLLACGLSLGTVTVRARLDRMLHWPFQLIGLGEFPLFELDSVPSLKTFAAMMHHGHIAVPDCDRPILLYLDELAQNQSVRRVGIMPIGHCTQRSIPLVLLSLYLTEAGQKVALLDTDFSDGSVTRLVTRLKLPVSAAISTGPGVSDYLSGQVKDVSDIVYPLGNTHCGSLIPSGDPVPADASPATKQRTLAQLEENLSSHYQYVFYGLPSVWQAPEGVTLGGTLDGVFLLVYPGVSTLDEIQQAAQALKAEHARILGVIFQPG